VAAAVYLFQHTARAAGEAGDRYALLLLLLLLLQLHTYVAEDHWMWCVLRPLNVLCDK
jgi:hypothetical protein